MIPAFNTTTPESIDAIPPIELVAGLPPQQVFDRLRQANHAGGLSQRMVAFYLEEMHTRRIYQLTGHANTGHWAAEQLDMDERRARELVQIGAALLQNEELDAALLDGRLSWSKVVTLARIVMPHTQEKWIELARTRNCAQLKDDVADARQGRNPSSGGKGPKRGAAGLSKPRFRFQASYGSEKQESLELIREEVMRELGKLVTDDELLDWFIDHGMERVKARADRHRSSEREPLGPRDRVPNWMRRTVMARDGYVCQCCGASTRLHVHHVVFRQHGGATSPENLLTVCTACHGRIHAGLLVVSGEAPDAVVMQARTGEPLQRPSIAGESVLRILREAESRDGGYPPRDAAVAKPQTLSVSDIPAVVDRNWWLQHEHLLEWRGGGFRVKAAARC